MTRTLACLVMLLWSASPIAHGCAGLEIKNAWVREPPPVATVAAGFAELLNLSAEPIAVVSVDSPCCDRVTVHRTVIENGRARMVPEPVIRIPPHGRAVLEPGGLHIMLTHPKSALRSGGRIALTVHCASGDTVTAMATVRRD